MLNPKNYGIYQKINSRIAICLNKFFEELSVSIEHKLCIVKEMYLKF
jgi:hypothetical protein